MKTLLLLMVLISTDPHYTEMPLIPLIYFEGMETCTDALLRMPEDEYLLNPKWRYRHV